MMATKRIHKAAQIIRGNNISKLMKQQVLSNLGFTIKIGLNKQ